MFEKIKARFTGRNGYRCHVMGNTALEKGNPEEAYEKHMQALELYKKAYDMGHREAQLLMSYAVLLMRYDRAQEAKEYLLEAEHLKNELDEKGKKQLRINYSVCQWRLGNLDKAIELMESAASTGMTAMIYTTLGYYYIERGRATGDFSQAIEFNNRAMEYDSDDAGILDNMGQQYFFMGEHDKAYEYFSRAYQSKATQAATLYYIACINLERLNLEKAEGFIDKCLEDGNFSALATITRQQAEDLKNEIMKAKGN